MKNEKNEEGRMKNEEGDPMTSQEKDIRRLNLLGICHYIFGGIFALPMCFSSIVLIKLIIMAIEDFVKYAPTPYSMSDPEWGIGTGVTYMVIIAVPELLGWGWTTCLFVSGRYLRRQEGRLFSMVIAGIECVLMLGVCICLPKLREDVIGISVLCFFALLSALGILTLVLLNTKSVRKIYYDNFDIW